MSQPLLLKRFRIIAVVEGISYVLFGITMPLKYIYGVTEPNFVVGVIHGGLFLLYCGVGLTCAIKYKWSFVFSLMVFLASLVPFATFYLDVKYLKVLSSSGD